jgi:outer membrane protein OmpA-like peptidoglycan-associated protein
MSMTRMGDRKAIRGVVLALACGLMLTGSVVISPGVKTEVKGRVNKRDVDTITIRDASDMEVVVLLTNDTAIKSSKKGLGLFRRGKNFEATSLMRGLMVEVDGTGNAAGQVAANEIRFNEADLKEVMTVHSRVQPVEDRLDETGKVASGAKESADAAHQRIDSVNDRITGLDHFVVSHSASVYFPLNKYTLSANDKKMLDELATKALAMKGYVIEVAGFADSTGNADKNLELSQRRADAVVQYLALTHSIPPRRIVTPIGYGDLHSQDGKTSEAQSRDRRVDAKILVNRGQA